MGSLGNTMARTEDGTLGFEDEIKKMDQLE